VVLAVLSVATVLLALTFWGWPLNRDITAYSVVAGELSHGERLYVDAWDVKPPGIYATYLIAQWVISSAELRILLLDVLPTLVVLVALVRAGEAAGFGRMAGVWSGLVWVVLSGDVTFQMHEPNAEIFIVACSSVAFLSVLGLGANSTVARLLWIGVLFALATLYKTVALATAVAVGVAYVVLNLPGTTLPARLRQLAWVAAAGAASLLSVVAYFVVTDRGEALHAAVVTSGAAYAGDLWQNILDALTFRPVIGDRIPLMLVLALGPWATIALLSVLDRARRRSWLLLGSFAFGSLLAVGLPGRFYAHYFQLLLPPLCLGVGWLAGLAGAARSAEIRRAGVTAMALLVGALALYESRWYVTPPREALAGTYQELYLETQHLGRRLGEALEPDEVLFQWGEESGLFFYSGKRPPTLIGSFALSSGPFADRLTRRALADLERTPPDLVVVAARFLDGEHPHPVLDWVRDRYEPLPPLIEGERRYFTFFVPNGSTAAFRRRVLGT
jgi:hypothetical protein